MVSTSFEPQIEWFEITQIILQFRSQKSKIHFIEQKLRGQQDCTLSGGAK
jgi:hypothetical protein